MPARAFDSAAALALFPATLRDAAEAQRSWAASVRIEPLSAAVKLVAGADLAYDSRRGTYFAVATVMDLETGRFVDEASQSGPARVPYVPGFLSFREGPAVIEALSRLSVRPDVLLCDGHGVAHPRRFGLACHLGIALDLPTIGVGKTILVGRHGDLDEVRGASASLVHREEVVGMALRTRAGVKPVFVSVGHRVSLEDACALVLHLAPRYRVPEPIRRAHGMVTRMRRATEG